MTKPHNLKVMNFRYTFCSNLIEIIKQQTDMKKYFIMVFSVLCYTFAATQPPQTAVTFQSKGHEHFWVYLNKQLQNTHADEVVIAKDLAPRTYQITIVMDNRQKTTLKTKITLHTGVNNFEVAYIPQNNRLILTTTDKYAQTSYTMGNMSYQKTSQYKSNMQRPHNTYQQAPVSAQNPAYNRQSIPPRKPAHVAHPTASHGTAALNAPRPCHEKDFLEIKHLIQKETFEDTKLTIAKQATSAEWLTVDQLSEIAMLFTYEDTKLQYLKFAYDFCYDPNKYYKLNKVFTYSSSIDELNEFVQAKRSR